MKKYPICRIYACALFISVFSIVACKKVELVNKPLSTGTVDNSTIAPNAFGEIINASTVSEDSAGTGAPEYILNISQKKNLAKAYGGYYYRMAITHGKWITGTGKTDFLNNYDTIWKAGFAIALNINWRDTGTVPFPDSANYGPFIREVLDSLNHHKLPNLIVVENEETNPGYYQINSTADINKYIKELKSGVDACAPYNLKVTNGGIVDRLMTYLTWDYIKNTQHDTAAARAYALSAMPPHIYNSMYPNLSALIAASIQFGKTFVNGYATLALSYINMHWYEPTNVRGWNDALDGGDPWTTYGYSKKYIVPGALDSAVAYLHYKFPSLKVVTNETGQLTTTRCLTTNLFQKYLSFQSSGDFPITIWYDGDGDDPYDAKALHNTTALGTYSLRPSGNTYKQDINGNIFLCP